MKLPDSKGPQQLILPLAHSEGSLRACLEQCAGCSVSLTVTDNATSMLSVRKKQDRVVVRLHRMFLGAGPDVIEEMARFIKRRKGETPLLRAFVKQNISGIKKKPPRKTALRTEGRYHALLGIFDSLNSEYFGGRLSCPVTWGTKSPRYAARRRTLGSYSRHSNIIRISPALDRKNTPAYFVAFVIYHEMLHADMKIDKKNGRRVVHSKEFRRREKLFRYYEKALDWEKKA